MLQQILCHQPALMCWTIWTSNLCKTWCKSRDILHGMARTSSGTPQKFSSWYFKQGEKWEKIDRKHGNAHTHQWILMVFYGENISRFRLQRTHWPLAEELCESRVSRRAWHAEAETRRRSMISQDDWSAHQMSKAWVTWWLVRSCWLRARKQSGHLLEQTATTSADQLQPVSIRNLPSSSSPTWNVILSPILWHFQERPQLDRPRTSRNLVL